MKSIFLILSIFSAFPALADNRGGETSGGGDLCEARIQSVRDDIRAWIRRGGAKGLVLTDLTLEQYEREMEIHFLAAKISCVGRGDAGYPVEVKGTPKTCRFDKSPAGERITCDIEKFESTGASGQYMLVHHEYAGLSGFEKPEDDVSSYVISNQIAGFLEERTEKRLGIVPREPAIFRLPFFGKIAVLDCTDARYYSIEHHANGNVREFYEQPGYTPCRSENYRASGKMGQVAFEVQNPARVHFYPDGAVEELYSMETFRDKLTITLDPKIGSFEMPLSMNVSFHPNGAVFWVRDGGNRYPRNRPLFFKYPNGRSAYVRQIVFKENGMLDRIEECKLDSSGNCI